MTRETYKSVYEAWVSDYVFYSWKHSILEVNFTISITFFMGARSQIDYHCSETKVNHFLKFQLFLCSI